MFFLLKPSLNSLIFQDDIAKMNYSMEDARKGAKDVGRLLESKQLRANTAKSKAVVLGPEEAREDILKTIREYPIKMGNQIVGDSAAEKYLGD